MVRVTTLSRGSKGENNSLWEDLRYLRFNLAREAALSGQAKAKSITSFLDECLRDRELLLPKEVRCAVTLLNLLKRSRFLPKGVLKDFYFKVILPSVKYGLVLWESCCNFDILIL